MWVGWVFSSSERVSSRSNCSSVALMEMKNLSSEQCSKCSE